MRYEYDKKTRKAIQLCARHEMLLKLLADINWDMEICKLEGWDAMEYVRMLKKEIDRICNLKMKINHKNEIKETDLWNK
jgi:hypothetical protein